MDTHNPLNRPGAQRHPLLAGSQEIGLVIVDAQEKFARVIPDFDQVVKNIAALAKGFQIFQLPIFATEQYPEGLGRTVKEISECIPRFTVVEKLTFSSLQAEEFSVQLSVSGIRKLAVCGLEAHVCVHQTVHDLLHRGYAVWVPQDAIGSRDPKNRDLALRRMESAGAIPTSTEMLLFEMAMQAGTETFKQIQKLIR
jgi:nicotinamidase-related amidase